MANERIIDLDEVSGDLSDRFMILDSDSWGPESLKFKYKEGFSDKIDSITQDISNTSNEISEINSELNNLRFVSEIEKIPFSDSINDVGAGNTFGKVFADYIIDNYDESSSIVYLSRFNYSNKANMQVTYKFEVTSGGILRVVIRGINFATTNPQSTTVDITINHMRSEIY